MRAFRTVVGARLAIKARDQPPWLARPRRLYLSRSLSRPASSLLPLLLLLLLLRPGALVGGQERR